MRALLARRAPVALAAMFLAGGCGQGTKTAEVVSKSGRSAAMERISAGNPNPAPSTARFLAVRTFLVLETDADKVEGVLKAAQDRCVAPDCELLESSLTRDSRSAPPRAKMRLRIAPKASDALVEDLVHRADVIERRAEAEDMTDQVVDVEARLKNTTELRDRLRGLLGTKGATLKDLVELEAQLARVQSELDSAEGRRKALANETEKVMVAIDIRSRPEITETGAFAPVVRALQGVGHTFAQSVASLIAFVAAVVPWLVLIVPAFLLFRRWRHARRARS